MPIKTTSTSSTSSIVSGKKIPIITLSFICKKDYWRKIILFIHLAQETEQNSKLNRQLSADNEELKRRLQAFERISEENRILRKTKEESDILRSCLKTSQDEVVRLLEEKKKLLDEMKNLQDQLAVDRGWQWNGSKR